MKTIKLHPQTSPNKLLFFALLTLFIPIIGPIFNAFFIRVDCALTRGRKIAINFALLSIFCSILHSILLMALLE